MAQVPFLSEIIPFEFHFGTFNIKFLNIWNNLGKQKNGLTNGTVKWKWKWNFNFGMARNGKVWMVPFSLWK